MFDRPSDGALSLPGVTARGFSRNSGDLAKTGAKVQTGSTMPYAGNDPKTGLPNGVDRGWDYVPEASVADGLARAGQQAMNKAMT